MQTTVLRTLALLREDDLDSGEILERLRSMQGDPPSVPSLYRCLRDAVDAGWIRVSGTEAPPGRGRPRQVYALTRTGRRAAEAEGRRLQHLAALALGEVSPEGESG